VVNELYGEYLRRPAEPTGLAAWSAFLAGGGTIDQLRARLLGSGEYLPSPLCYQLWRLVTTSFSSALCETGSKQVNIRCIRCASAGRSLPQKVEPPMHKVTIYIAPYVHCPFPEQTRAGEPVAYRLLKNGEIEQTPVRSLQARDKVVVDSGRTIPGDGEIVQGCAAVDESASTGQSSPVIREAGGDRSEVIGGTRVLRGHIVVLLRKVSARIPV
jgi:hypothetical protein